MKPAIIQIESMLPSVEATLAEHYDVHRLAGRADLDGLPAAARAGIRAIVTGGGTGAAPALIEALPQLEIITINGVGTDAVDLELCRSRGVRVTNTPDVLTDDVADLAVGLMLAVLRKLCLGDRFVRAGAWGKGKFALGSKMTGKRLGIVGLGRIGRAIAKRAGGFDMAISYHDQRAFEDVPYRFEPSLRSLARDSDILVVAASGGAGSRHLVDRAVMDALGAKGILVNVARGSIVDEQALVEALLDGRLGGAGLDAFQNEPHVPEALFALDQVVLEPHQASATHETREAMGRLVTDNLAAHFAGRPLLTTVV